MDSLLDRKIGFENTGNLSNWKNKANTKHKTSLVSVKFNKRLNNDSLIIYVGPMLEEDWHNGQ